MRTKPCICPSENSQGSMEACELENGCFDQLCGMTGRDLGRKALGEYLRSVGSSELYKGPQPRFLQRAVCAGSGRDEQSWAFLM